jgi:uncharacterized protein YcbX
MSNPIASIAALYVYPVKSMAGIAAQEAHVGFDGILGDRQYSFIRGDQAARNSFPWMTARQSASMLLYKPQFAQAPTPDVPEPGVSVRTPAGAVCEPNDSGLCQELADKLGHPVFLLKSGRGLFDCQHVSLFSLATVRALAEEAGCPIDPRQFRANVYLEPGSQRAFDEESWTDCLLQIGADVLIGVTQRDSRCMMVNLNPDTGEQNPRVLKTIAQAHQGQAGIYANVVRPGLIRVGDAIRVLTKVSLETTSAASC